MSCDEAARVTAILDAAREIPCDLALWEHEVRSAPAALRAWAAAQMPVVKLETHRLDDGPNHIAEGVLWCEAPGRHRISVYLLPNTDDKISGR